MLVILALMGVVLLVGWPLIRTGAGRGAERDAARIEDLLAARESTYRQIRELELDHRTGKLDKDDFRAQDRALRARAVDILRELDDLGVGSDPAQAPAVAEEQPDLSPATLHEP